MVAWIQARLAGRGGFGWMTALATTAVAAAGVASRPISFACQAAVLVAWLVWGRLLHRRAVALDAARASLECARADAELFLSCVPSILIGLDPRGNITRWNDAAAGTLGVSAEQAVGKTLAGCGIRWLQDDIAARVASWLESAAPSHQVDDIRYERDGSVRLLGLRLRRIDGPGPSTGFVVTGADTTDRRALEEELRQAQRLEAVGQMAAGIAHEINTPIQYVGDNLRFLQEAFENRSVVMGQYEQVRRAAEAGVVPGEMLASLSSAIVDADLDYLNQEIPKAMAQSLDGVDRVATIVRAMKEFAHPGQLDKAAADLNRALQNALIVARNEIKYVAEVETDFGELPPVVCRIADINQVFLNLLVNAAHAVADVVKPTGQKGKIAVRTRREGGGVVVSISDTGCGIPESIRSKIFDPFFTTKPVGRGSGQGLSIARAIVVEQHGGRLTFQPNPIQGTTFLVSLPIDAPPAPQSA